MPLDPSIYAQLQTPNLGEAFGQGQERGMRMSDLVQDRKAKQKKMEDQMKLSDLAKTSMKTNADGTQSFDQNAFASNAIQNGLFEPGIQMNQTIQDQKNKETQFGIDNKKIDQHSEDLKEMMKSREQVAWESAQARRQNAEMAANAKLDSTNDKDAQLLDKHLSLGWAGRSGQAGNVQAKINSAERLEGLLEQAKNQPGGLDSRQYEEMAIGTANMLAPGTPAMSTIEKLIPHTWYGGTQTLKEYLSGKPQGQGFEEFTSRLADTIAREKAISQDQMRQYQIEGLPAFNSYSKRDPEGYQRILKAKGLDSSMIDENGRYKKAAPASSGQASQAPATDDKKAVEWALAHPEHKSSMAVLKAAGYAVGKN